MIPRLHKRGNSFKGALGYVLHDPGKSTSERVGWAVTQNIYSHPEDAWFEMFDTYRNRTALKANSGVDARGRDNKTPVLHYTLAWAASDNPSREHMEAMARDSLKALGLSEHEAVIACHTDKGHHHVHVVVNTVHPYTGKTAPMKFSKLEFSRWAEAYEKEHGIHCEERIKNNEKRREIAKDRETERAGAALAILLGRQPVEPAPFEPVNDNSLNRRRWFERKEIVDKMKALRAALDQDHRTERGETWAAQLRERDQLDRATRKSLDLARDIVSDQFKGKWNTLYQAWGREARHLSAIATHPLERAVYVFRNRDRLSANGKPMTLRRMIPLILSGAKLNKAAVQMHDRERRALARSEKEVTKRYTDQLWQNHRAAFHALRDRQASERAAEKAHQVGDRKDITFARAKDSLIREADQLAAPSREQPQAQRGDAEPTRARTNTLDAVPIAPRPRFRFKRPSRSEQKVTPQERPRADAKSVLMPQAIQTANQAPVAKPMKATAMERDPAALLMRPANMEKGIPAVPQQRQPEAQQPEPRKQQAAKPFRDAAFPRAPDVDDAFKRAAAPQRQPQPAKKEQSPEERIRQEFARWARSRGRGDFERER
jgi:hypothetical protein